MAIGVHGDEIECNAGGMIYKCPDRFHVLVYVLSASGMAGKGSSCHCRSGKYGGERGKCI